MSDCRSSKKDPGETKERPETKISIKETKEMTLAISALKFLSINQSDRKLLNAFMTGNNQSEEEEEQTTQILIRNDISPDTVQQYIACCKNLSTCSMNDENARIIFCKAHSYLDEDCGLGTDCNQAKNAFRDLKDPVADPPINLANIRGHDLVINIGEGYKVVGVDLLDQQNNVLGPLNKVESNENAFRPSENLFNSSQPTQLRFKIEIPSGEIITANESL